MCQHSACLQIEPSSLLSYVFMHCIFIFNIDISFMFNIFNFIVKPPTTKIGKTLFNRPVPPGSISLFKVSFTSKMSCGK